MRFKGDYRSVAGPRPDNQDSAATASLLGGQIAIACIADGVGGAYGGAFASSLATKDFAAALTSDPEADLAGIIQRLNESVVRAANSTSDLRGMATTFTGCRLRDNTLEGIHVGDSRAFLLRRNGIKQLTEDQTEVNRLFKEGLLSDIAASSYPRSNVLECALGFPKCVPQAFTHDIEAGDRLVLTTDGVHSRIRKALLRDLSVVAHSPNELCDLAIGRALELGTTDNATIAAIFIEHE